MKERVLMEAIDTGVAVARMFAVIVKGQGDVNKGRVACDLTTKTSDLPVHISLMHHSRSPMGSDLFQPEGRCHFRCREDWASQRLCPHIHLSPRLPSHCQFLPLFSVLVPPSLASTGRSPAPPVPDCSPSVAYLYQAILVQTPTLASRYPREGSQTQ